MVRRRMEALKLATVIVLVVAVAIVADRSFSRNNSVGGNGWRDVSELGDSSIVLLSDGESVYPHVYKPVLVAEEGEGTTSPPYWIKSSTGELVSLPDAIIWFPVSRP